MPISPIDITLVYPDGRRDRVRLREKALNQGADGLIYASPDGKLALKLYHDPEKDPERPEKIRQMLQAPPDDKGLEHFAWPVAQAVNRKGRFIGYAMPLLPLGEYESLELLLTRKGRRLAGLPESRMFRIQAAENLARRVAQLHDKGHFVIDMKPANLLVHRKTADIVVVDCDGFAIQGQHSFIPGHQYTPGYIAPEAWKNRVEPEGLGKAQDLFALAVIIFQLVNEGLHPYQGVPDAKQNIPGDTQNRIGEDLFAHGKQRHPRMRPSPWSLHRDFPGSLAQAFHNAFTSINRRPDAGRWATLLESLAGKLKPCKKEKNHFFWGEACPTCKLSSVTIRPKKPKRAGPRAKPPYTSPAQPTVQQNQVPHRAQRSLIPVRSNSRTLSALAGSLLVILLLGLMFSDDSPRNPQSYHSDVQTEEEKRRSERREQERKARLERDAWRNLGTREAGYALGHSTYILPEVLGTGSTERPDGAGEIERTPYFQVGRFESYDDIPLAIFPPRVPLWEYGKDGGVTVASLGSLRKTSLPTVPEYPVSGFYQMTGWHIQPGSEALYLRKCSARANCFKLARIAQDGTETVFPVARGEMYSARLSQNMTRSWHFAVTDDEKYVIIAGHDSIRVHSVTDPETPVAETEYPTPYDDFEVSDLAITPDGTQIYVGLTLSEERGLNYQATVLEYSLRGGKAALTTDFLLQWQEMDSIPAPSVDVSKDGKTLAIGAYGELEEEAKDDKWGDTITTNTGLPGIQIWEKQADTANWHQTGSYRLNRREQVTTPDNPAIFIRSLISRLLRGSYRFNIDFDLSDDGTRLLSGIEAEQDSRNQLIARAWVLDVREGVPELRARLQGKMPYRYSRSPASRISNNNYLFVRLANDSSKAVMGWARYTREMIGKQDSELELSLTAFNLGETDPPTPPSDTESLTTR